MKHKWTDGPWVITDMGTLIQECGNENRPIEVAGINIAHYSYYGESNHRTANARLIASAPDLYNALERMLSASNGTEYEAGVLDAHAAMCKARGEKP